MTESFRKLMRKQVQERLDSYRNLSKSSAPKNGWIKTILETLGMPNRFLAKKMGCSEANVTQLLKNEVRGSISIQTLEKVAEALNCKFFYCLVPMEPFEKMIEKQAREIAKKRINIVNHTMHLERQGLSEEQIKKQEADLVRELLNGSSKKIWADDDKI